MQNFSHHQIQAKEGYLRVKCCNEPSIHYAKTSHPLKDAPKPGQPEVRTNANGKEEKWCSKCKKPRWRSDKGAHTTSEHRSQKPKPVVTTAILTPTTSSFGLAHVDQTLLNDSNHGNKLLVEVNHENRVEPFIRLRIFPGLMDFLGDKDLNFGVSYESTT